MPVPKAKRKLYALVVGRMINLGKGLAAAKRIADRAIKSKRKKR